MKKYWWVVIGLLLFTGHSCQVAIDFENETEAIKTVIEEETHAFLNKDFDRMAATYVKEETVYDPEGNVLFKLIVVRILEKEDDTWKIVSISVVNTSSYEEYLLACSRTINPETYKDYQRGMLTINSKLI
ncbi:MAG: hypothetical protein U9R60_05420 [Bacteroidota bacterium]|nr:hypothetical protein [Bacteroidota bacterium]